MVGSGRLASLMRHCPGSLSMLVERPRLEQVVAAVLAVALKSTFR
eukprot:COSAG04_NODE_17587_length_465_cov_0.702186_2_plen_44_part_01